MTFIKNNLSLLLGAAAVFATGIIRIFDRDPELVWLGTLGVLAFVVGAVGQFMMNEYRIQELQKDVERLENKNTPL